MHSIDAILAETHPYDLLSSEERSAIAAQATRRDVAPGTELQTQGERQEALFLIISGVVEVRDADGTLLSILGRGNSFGERGLMRDGIAAATVTAAEPADILAIPAATFDEMVDAHPPVRRFFERGRRGGGPRRDITALALSEVMTRDPLTCDPQTTVQNAARVMRDAHVSCIIVTKKDQVVGILTSGDMTNRVVAQGIAADVSVSDIMTRDPVTLPPDALISDVLHLMVERGFTHMPVADAGRLVGILTQTDLTRAQAQSSGALIQDIAEAPDGAALAQITGRIPDLLVQLVGAHHAHQVVTRLITDVADAATRRLIALAEKEFGPAPVPYLWAACGSQGRQEQTGVSDQDNCLILSDEVSDDHEAYFEALARFVCDGLNEAGYVYCPGDMMATNPRWRQPARVWRQYFQRWIAKPDKEAQMLASVMFDLRAIGGDADLLTGLQAETLSASAANSIFVAHMTSNSLSHQPPLGIFRGLATIRAGEHKDALDLKHNGVVPVVDLGRLYALQGKITAVNTRMRLTAAIAGGQLSKTGGHDLIDAYDLIAETRLAHQAELVKRGEAPDNFMHPAVLSDFERAHLRDAFVVIKTMQSAAASRGGVLN